MPKASGHSFPPKVWKPPSARCECALQKMSAPMLGGVSGVNPEVGPSRQAALPGCQPHRPFLPAPLLFHQRIREW